MANYDQVIQRWLDIVFERTDKGPLKNERMPVIGDVIYSYGTHFPLAEPLRQRGRVVGFLLNGDTWGPTTNKHQIAVREAVKRAVHDTDMQVVIIPSSVLSEAGVDESTIRVLDVSEDRTETIHHVHREQPARSVWEYEKVTLPGTGGYVHKVTGEWLEDYHAYETRFNGDVGYYSATAQTWDEWCASKMKAQAEWQEIPRVTKTTGRRTLKIAKDSWQTWDLVDVDGELTYQRETYRHWLGESLIEATVSYQSLIKCRRCKGVGVHEGDTRAAWAFVEGPAPEGKYHPLEQRVDRPTCNECWGRRRHTVNRTRKAKFLSGFDQNEARPSYFFCELPKTDATTIADAYAALKPATVRLAEEMGREVKRQGDIFAVPVLNLTKRDLTKSGATFERGAHILGTNHKVTEVARLQDGRTLARGTITHAPELRRPDHARVTIGKEWHLIVKNTVPVASNR